MCDRRESGQTQSRMMNYQGGWKCDACGFTPRGGDGSKGNYLVLMAMKPRMERLVIQEKQPANSVIQPMWISQGALSALQERFPSNFRTTIYSLFNELATPGSILIEAKNAVELKDLGITKGRDIVGLAKTNIALTEQLKQLQDQMKQFEWMSRMMAAAQGGLANTPQSQQPAIEAILNPAPAERPPQQPVMPIISTESEEIYEPAEPGSFSVGLDDLTLPTQMRPPGMPKPQPSAR